LPRRIRHLPQYQRPFESSDQVRALAARYLQSRALITDDECLRAGFELLNGRELRLNLRLIFQWKLQSFIKRFRWVREFPDEIKMPNESLERILAIIKSASAGEEAALNALQELDRLKFVNVPVASALLMAVYPDEFTVIDRQAYKTLGAEFIEPIPYAEYLHYVRFCRNEAKSLGVSLRNYDRALWQAGSDLGRAK
jgi:hypothetical protein